MATKNTNTDIHTLMDKPYPSVKLLSDEEYHLILDKFSSLSDEDCLRYQPSLNTLFETYFLRSQKTSINFDLTYLIFSNKYIKLNNIL
jgi:hypothetical protein